MRQLIAFSLLVTIAVSCGTPSDEGKPNHYLVEGVAIEGYDPVAYFTQSEAVKGNSEYSLKHNGITYHFASEENKALFEKNPDKY